MKSAICSLNLRDLRRTALLAEGAEQTRGEAGRGDAQSPAVEAGARMKLLNAARQPLQWPFVINMATFWLSR